MMLVVLIAGIGLLAAGVVTIGFGIELDLSFGNTLLLAGAIVACTGVLMLGLWIAVRELKAIAGQLSGLAAPSGTVSLLPASGSGAALDDQAPEHGAMEPALPVEPAPSAARPPSSDRGRGEVAPAAKPRRSLLFSTSSRKERERAQAREPSIADLNPGAPDLASRATPSPEDSNQAPLAGFDDSWPRPERARTPDLPRRGGRTPSTFTEPDAGADTVHYAAPAAPGEDQPPVTVLKSGVVDGMAYSLYSDGSIEAQMPEGMMRFASIDELRAHLDQRP